MTGRFTPLTSFLERLRRADLKKAGISVGSEAVVLLATRSERIDLSDLPTFRGGRPDDARRHDELPGRARMASLKGKRK